MTSSSSARTAWPAPLFLVTRGWTPTDTDREHGLGNGRDGPPHVVIAGGAFGGLIRWEMLPAMRRRPSGRIFACSVDSRCPSVRLRPGVGRLRDPSGRTSRRWSSSWSVCPPRWTHAGAMAIAVLVACRPGCSASRRGSPRSGRDARRADRAERAKLLAGIMLIPLRGRPRRCPLRSRRPRESRPPRSHAVDVQHGPDGRLIRSDARGASQDYIRPHAKGCRGCARHA